MAFATSANFAHSRHRGFRVPNRYSAKDPEELKALGVREHITVSNARHLDPAPTLDSHGFQLVVAPTALDLMDTDDRPRTLLRGVPRGLGAGDGL